MLGSYLGKKKKKKKKTSSRHDVSNFIECRQRDHLGMTLEHSVFLIVCKQHFSPKAFKIIGGHKGVLEIYQNVFIILLEVALALIWSLLVGGGIDPSILK